MTGPYRFTPRADGRVGNLTTPEGLCYVVVGVTEVRHEGRVLVFVHADGTESFGLEDMVERGYAVTDAEFEAWQRTTTA